MIGFRSLAYFDGWPAGGGELPVMRRTFSPARPGVGKKDRRKLSGIVEADVIPVLLRLHSPAARRSEAVDERDVGSFSFHLARGDVPAAERMIAKLRSDGLSIASLYLNLFTPAARFLGELWVEDACDFAGVTIALSHLQQIVRRLSPEFQGVRRSAHAAAMPTALLVAVPGDDHDFGVELVREFFRRDGWSVSGGTFDTYDSLLKATKERHYNVIGLSVSNDKPVDGLANVIRAMRKSVTGPDTKIMVGGRFFLEHPEFVNHVGADATASDGRGAVARISSLLDTSALQC